MAWRGERGDRVTGRELACETHPLRRGARCLTPPAHPLLCLQESGKGGKAKDFLGLGLKDGHLVFR